MLGISIIICCYNSANRISETLKYIAEQKVISKIKWEVIIVDNNSNDNTSSVALFEWKKYRSEVPFKIITEEKQGLAAARHKGVKESNFDFLLFCDDDNWLCENYVSTAFKIMNNNPKIGILGGCSEAVSKLDVVFPKWFKYNASSYAVGKPSLVSGDITSRKYLWGAGMVVRKAIYNLAYRNNPSLLIGRKGEELSSGEDAELCARTIILGYTLYYEASLHFKHFILPERLTKNYFKKLISGHKSSYNILKYYWHYIDYINQPTSFKWKITKESIYRIILSFIKTQNLSRKNYFLLIYILWKQFNFSKSNSYQNVLNKTKSITINT